MNEEISEELVSVILGSQTSVICMCDLSYEERRLLMTLRKCYKLPFSCKRLLVQSPYNNQDEIEAIWKLKMGFAESDRCVFKRFTYRQLRKFKNLYGSKSALSELLSIKVMYIVLNYEADYSYNEQLLQNILDVRTENGDLTTWIYFYGDDELYHYKLPNFLTYYHIESIISNESDIDLYELSPYDLELFDDRKRLECFKRYKKDEYYAKKDGRNIPEYKVSGEVKRMFAAYWKEYKELQERKKGLN